MDSSLATLTVTAATVGVLHTALGPDHYVPFVAMAQAGRWPLRRTLLVTLLCGGAHVASSVVIGFAGLAVGAAVGALEALETIRGDLAGWLLLGFGLAYLCWGLRVALVRRPALHHHAGPEATAHRPVRWTPWVLFLVFVLGPCEPLIPLLLYPASKGDLRGVLAVVGAFSAATLLVMTALVGLALLGLAAVVPARLTRFGHAMAGAAVTACGVLVKLGW